MTDDRPWKDAALNARHHERRIECGPFGPDRDALATGYHRDHKLAGGRPAASCARVDDRAAPHHTRRQHAYHQPASDRHRAGADRRRRGARRAPVPGVLCRQHPQPAHAAGLWPCRGGIHGLVRGQPCAVDHRRAAAACRRLDRAADARTCGADRQAAPGRIAPSVRLAGDRPGAADQPGRIGARPGACGEGGQDAGAGAGGSAR
jgi:hypothetical protein